MIVSADKIIAALQEAIDRDRPGWRVSHFVAAVGLDRIDGDDQIETSASVYYTDGQADYITNGLLIKAGELLDEQARNEEGGEDGENE